MGKFLEAHPDLYNAAEIDVNGTKYTRLSTSNRIIEVWEKDAKGEWHDNTEIYKVKEALELEKAKLKALKRKQTLAEKQDRQDE